MALFNILIHKKENSLALLVNWYNILICNGYNCN